MFINVKECVYTCLVVFLQFYPPLPPSFIFISASRHCTYDLGHTIVGYTHKLNELLSIHFKEIWWVFDKEKRDPLSTRKIQRLTDWLCCAGPPVHTATTDTHRHDAGTSRQLGILSKFVGCRWMWTGPFKVTVTIFSCRVVVGSCLCRVVKCESA
jgi:hypothetical protein